MPFPDHEATNAHGVPMFQGNVILRLAHAYIRLSPGPAGELQRRHPAAGRSRVRNVDSTAELFALADLDESRGTLSASRRLSLADLRGASRQINAPPLAPARQGAHTRRAEGCAKWKT